ncbi:MAG: S9 family peptidase [Elusimicrobia bacterium]|nr:S9 family peptidase [Elusimicrobiota bacterium]
MTATAQAPKLIPREILFGNPERAMATISPDGRRLGYLAPDQGVLNVWVSPLSEDGRVGEGRPVTKDRARGIRMYFWTEDRRSLVYLQDKGGDENWRLFQVDVETLAERDLTPFEETQAQVVGTDPHFPDELLVALNLRDKRFHDVYRVSLKTGAAVLEVENPGDVVGWLADTAFRVRACKAALPDGGWQLRVRDDDDAPWRPFASWGPDDHGGAHAFTPDNRGLYVESSVDSDTTRLWEMTLSGGERKLLAHREDVDVGSVLFHPKRYHIQAVGFEAERLCWQVLDPEIQGDFDALAKAAEGDFQIVSRDDADRFWVILYNFDRRPASYYLYDRTSRKATLLFTTRPKLEGQPLAAMKPVTIRARDGLALHGYLSLPAGAAAKRLPLVLNVHGGPWARDIWGYHPEAQWLANRGYACLQVNFRGSMGFGKRFLHAGDREWGAKMQDDLTDAVEWAVKEGIADPKRVAVYGASYGGYAALAGAAFTPDLYACAVDIVGPSNIATLIQSIPPYWEPLRRIFDLRVGNVQTELDFLNSRSPLFKAHQIKIPVLIAQGANDPRVKQAESEMIVSALRSKGKPVEYLLFADEGHGFARPENRLKFYAQAEAFLAKHLGGRLQAS